MHTASGSGISAMMKTMRAAVLVTASLGMTAAVTMPVAMLAQAAAAPATAAPRQAGTVKSVSADSLVLTNAAGQEFTATIPAGATVLVVPPGAKDLSSAKPGTIADVAVGDKVLVTGLATDTGSSLTARRVVLMKSAAIASMHAAEDAEWAQGGGGIVKSVDASTGTLTVSSGMKPLIVKTTPATDVRRYANGSVKASDAVKSTVASIAPGDQLRVRGAKSPDGGTITADAILVGSFKNYSGLVSGIDPAAGTITLKDLTTKKPVTVAITPNSDVRNLPERMATFVAMRLKGQAPGGGAGAGQGGGQGAGAQGGSDEQRAGRARMDLAQMLSRLPTSSLADLKTGDAVLIVAMPSATGSGPATAVTLLSGVQPLLEASPNGQAMTLSPWSLGGGDAGAAGGAMPQ